MKKTKLHILIPGTIILGLMICFSTGCAGEKVNLKQTPLSVSTPVPVKTEYRIHPGDSLDIKFFYNSELNETLPVRPDGKISLQLIDDIQAAGRTPSQLDEDLTWVYAQELRNPEITVIVRTFTGQRVYVGGEVTKPGIVVLAGGMSPLQAVFFAGGFKETASPGSAIVIRKGPDGELYPIRVDLDKEINGESEEEIVQLQAYDVVYVPKSFIAKANKFMRQYVQDLLLLNGFYYDLTDDIR